MRRKTVSGIMLTLLLIGMLILTFNIQPVKSEPTTIIVPDDYEKIQWAIGNASDGDTIFVRADIYYEHLTIDKSISLIGENKHNTIIDGNGTGTVVEITANNVSINGFTIQNSAWPDHHGIYVYCSSGNNISGNIITNNGGGIHTMRSYYTPNFITGNIISNNWEGICLDDYGYTVLMNNTISHNNLGITLCAWMGVLPRIFHNNFIDNADQGYRIAAYALWDDGYPSGGNYWSDYTGVDVKSGPNQDQPGSDGIGDTPYVFDYGNIDNYPLMYPWGAPPPPSYTLTIYSSPTGVTFTVDGVSRTTPWSGTYSEGASVSLVMPEIHTVGDARYYWSQWSDGNTSRSRTVTMNTDITLTAYYTGPYYQLTVTSSPITGISFTINGAPKTTPYTEWLLEGSYTLVMPETHNGYVWSHWLEDGDTNRIKTITLQGTTWTAVYEPAPKPVGGKATPINIPMNKPETPTLWIWLTTIILSLVLAGVYVKKRKRNTRTLPYVKC